MRNHLEYFLNEGPHKAMKILIGCSSPPHNGSGILSYSVEIAKCILKKGHNIYFASPPAVGAHPLSDYSDVVYLHTTQHDDVRRRCSELVSYIKDEGIDVVINNDNPLVQNLAPFINVPFISVGHLGKKSIASLACYQHQWSDYVVAISNDMHEIYTKKFKVPGYKCPIIYNGIEDDEGFSETKLSVPEEPLRVVYAGGGNNMKGADIVSRLVHTQSESWGGISISWYGDIPDNIRRHHASLEHVNMVGKVSRSEILDILKCADVLLFPSREEGCPMAIIEAKKYGVIPIVSDGVGAMRTMVTSGIDGYTCYLNEWPIQAMQCLQQLARDRSILNEMKLASRASFESDFAVENTVEKLLALAAHPVVDRNTGAAKATLVRWHRPLRPDSRKSPFVDRVFYRLGILRKEGEVKNL